MTESMPIPADQPQLVVAVFEDRARADAAVQALRGRGVPDNDISVILRHDHTSITPDQMEAIDRESTSVSTDVAVGGTVGGLAGLLGGLALFSIPGLGPFLGTGVLVSTLGGAAIGSAVGERWAHGHFESLGVSQERSARYGTALETGSVVVAITARDAAAVMLLREALTMQAAEEIDVYAQGTTP